MKILFVFEFGILNYRLPLLDELSKLPFVDQISVIHTEDFTGKEFSFTEKKIKVLKLGRFKFHLGIQKLIKENDVIIASFNLWRPSWIPLLFNKSYRKKIILWGHGFSKNHNSFVQRKIRIFLARRASALIFYTKNGLEGFCKNGIIKEKLFIGQNTLKINNVDSFDFKNKTQFLYVGRIQDRKGLDELIMAFAIFCKGNSHIQLKFIGNGDCSKLKQLVSDFELGTRVFFEPGCFDEKYLKEQFIQSVAYISPNHVGLGVVHSFAYGVPVITKSDKKHAPEFDYCQNMFNSILYEGTKFQLAEIMQKITQDISFLKELSLNAFNTYKSELSFELMVEGFEHAIKYTKNRS